MTPPSAAAPGRLHPAQPSSAQLARWPVTVLAPLASAWFWVQAGPTVSSSSRLPTLPTPARLVPDTADYVINSLSYYPHPTSSSQHPPRPHAKSFGPVRFLPGMLGGDPHGGCCSGLSRQLQRRVCGTGVGVGWGGRGALDGEGGARAGKRGWSMTRL